MRWYDIQGKPELKDGQLLETEFGSLIIKDKLGEGNFSQAYSLYQYPNEVVIIATKDPERGRDNDYAKAILSDYLWESGGQSMRYFPFIKYAGELDPNNQVYISKRYYFDDGNNDYFSPIDRSIRCVLGSFAYSIRGIVTKALWDQKRYPDLLKKFKAKDRKMLQAAYSRMSGSDFQIPYEITRLQRDLFIEAISNFNPDFTFGKKQKSKWHSDTSAAKYLENGRHITNAIFFEKQQSVGIPSWTPCLYQNIPNNAALEHKSKDFYSWNNRNNIRKDGLLLREDEWNQDYWDDIVRSLAMFNEYLNDRWEGEFAINYDFNPYNVAKVKPTEDSFLVFPDLIHAHPMEDLSIPLPESRGVYEFPHRW
jgi:hypothetical protein